MINFNKKLSFTSYKEREIDFYHTRSPNIHVSLLDPKILDFIIDNNIIIKSSNYNPPTLFYFTYSNVDDILYEDEIKLYLMRYGSNGYYWKDVVTTSLDEDYIRCWDSEEDFVFSTYDEDKSSLLKLKMFLL